MSTGDESMLTLGVDLAADWRRTYVPSMCLLSVRGNHGVGRHDADNPGVFTCALTTDVAIMSLTGPAADAVAARAKTGGRTH